MKPDAIQWPSQPAPMIGRLTYFLLPIRRRVMMENLARVFGETRSRCERVSLAQWHYAHLWRSAREIVRSLVSFRTRREPRVRVEGVEVIRDAGRRGGGILLLGCHLGNWEIAPLAGLAPFLEGHGRFHVVRRALPFRWLEALIERHFTSGGVHVLWHGRGPSQIRDQLRRNDAVVFLFDQAAMPREGVVVDFLGQPALTFRGPALLALTAKVPVAPLVTWREPDGTHVVHIGPPIPMARGATPDETVKATTRAYNDALEPFVLAHPEQWFWLHRRWKRVVTQGSAARAAGETRQRPS